MSFPSFRRQLYAIPRQESLNAPSVFNGPEEGEILKLYQGRNKYRADIRLFSGTVLKKIRLPGPHYSKLGYQHGHKTGFKTGQRVKLVYLENRRDAPVVDTVYSLPGGEKETVNLDLAEYDPEEVSTGHESGHKTIWDDNKVVFQDKLSLVKLEINYLSDTIKLQTKLNSIQLNNDSTIELKSGKIGTPQKAILGEDLIDYLSRLIDAILQITVMSPVGPTGTVSAIASNLQSLESLRAELQSLLSKGVKNN